MMVWKALADNRSVGEIKFPKENQSLVDYFGPLSEGSVLNKYLFCTFAPFYLRVIQMYAFCYAPFPVVDFINFV